MNTAMGDAAISCWDTKYYYFYPRPSQANPDIRSTFMTPNFPSYTSGHSTFSGAAAEFLVISSRKMQVSFKILQLKQVIPEFMEEYTLGLIARLELRLETTLVIIPLQQQWLMESE